MEAETTSMPGAGPTSGHDLRIRLHYAAFSVAVFLDWLLYTVLKGLYEAVDGHGLVSLEAWKYSVVSLGLAALAIPFTVFVIKCRTPLVIRRDGFEQTTVRFGTVSFSWSDILELELPGLGDPKLKTSSAVVFEITEECRRRLDRNRSRFARRLLPLPKRWGTPGIMKIRGERLFDLMRSRRRRALSGREDEPLLVFVEPERYQEERS